MKCGGRHFRERIYFLSLDRSLRLYILFTTLKTADLSSEKSCSESINNFCVEIRANRFFFSFKFVGHFCVLGMPGTSQYNHGFWTSPPVWTDPFNVNFNDSIVQHNKLELELYNFSFRMVFLKWKIFSNICVRYNMILHREK